MNSFEELCAQLDTMAKAMPKTGDGDGDGEGTSDAAGMKKIEAAAKDGGRGGDEEGEDDETFGKSFQVTLADGSVVDALDGTAMMKALHAENGLLRDRVLGHDGELAKAMQFSAGLLAQVAAQGEMLKSLQADVARFGSTGSGRKAVLSVADKPVGPAAGQGAGAAPGDVMAKAMTLSEAGRMTAKDVAAVEMALQTRRDLPPHLANLLASA